MTPRQLSLLLLLGAVWGASFLFIAETVEALGPIGVADGRVALAAAALVAYAALTTGMPALRARWRDHLLLGAAGVAVPFALISAAELELPASLAAILNATAPLGSALVAAAFLAEPLRPRQALGLVVALAGVALVVGLAPLELDLGVVLAVGASLLAALSYAVAGHLTRAADELAPTAEEVSRAGRRRARRRRAAGSGPRGAGSVPGARRGACACRSCRLAAR